MSVKQTDPSLPLYFLGKMGQRNDTMAVADSNGKVFGVSNLRVADISAFPLLPPGHPQATVCKYSARSICQLYLISSYPRDPSLLFALC